MVRKSLEEAIPFISEVEGLDLGDETDLLSLERRPGSVSRLRNGIIAKLKKLGLAIYRTYRLLLRVVLPSYLQHREAPIHPAIVRPTAYLDSLRGIAALFVVVHHYTYIAWEENDGFGAGEDPKKNRYVMQLPIIRLVHTGAPMVAIFFIISGFVLSIKPLRAIRAMESGSSVTTHSDMTYTLLHQVSGSVIGRWFRLFVPTLVATLAIVTMLQLQWYQSTRKMSEDKKILAGDWEDQPVQEENLSAELWKWVWAWAKFSHSYSRSIVYDEHLWTISMEWQCSLRLYFTLLVTSCMTSRMRLATLVIFVIWAVGWHHWELIEFWTGMAMAEWRLRQEEEKTTTPPPESSSKERSVSLSSWFRQHADIWWALNLVCGLYLMSYPPVSPAKAKDTPGYATLARISSSAIEDQFRLWHAIGAAQCVASIGSLDQIKYVFSIRPLRYLGEISFPLYLVHGPIFHTFGYNMVRLCWNHITGGHASRTSYSWGIVLAAIPSVIVVFYVADRFTEWVDGPTIRLSKWVQSTVVPKRVRNTL